MENIKKTRNIPKSLKVFSPSSPIGAPLEPLPDGASTIFQTRPGPFRVLGQLDTWRKWSLVIEAPTPPNAFCLGMGGR